MRLSVPSVEESSTTMSSNSSNTGVNAAQSSGMSSAKLSRSFRTGRITESWWSSGMVRLCLYLCRGKHVKKGGSAIRDFLVGDANETR